MEDEIYYCSCGNRTELTESGLCMGCEAMAVLNGNDYDNGEIINEINDRLKYWRI